MERKQRCDSAKLLKQHERIAEFLNEVSNHHNLSATARHLISNLDILMKEFRRRIADGALRAAIRKLPCINIELLKLFNSLRGIKLSEEDEAKLREWCGM